MNGFGEAGKIDHVAIAVRDLDEALKLYRDQLGMRLITRRTIEGERSGMQSAELDAGAFSIVLVQGTSDASQVSRFIAAYGPGVQHIAVAVEDIDVMATQLLKQGVEFATDMINGDGLRQIFTRRDKNSGVMWEFIQRTDAAGFEEGNIKKLFAQLEASEQY